MTDVAIITGSEFYDFDGVHAPEQISVDTTWGKAEATLGHYRGKSIIFIPRDRTGHRLLPNMINHRANIAACAQHRVKAVLATSVCGVLRADIPLGRPLLFNDLFFLDNRLPDGSACTFFTQEGQPSRGHLMFSNPFCDVSSFFGEDILSNKTYGHVNGPRFNSRSEIGFLATYCDAISQTCGPEVILSNEIEIPYVLMGYGVNYADGVNAVPTSRAELNENLARSKSAFQFMIDKLLDEATFTSQSFMYRFED